MTNNNPEPIKLDSIQKLRLLIDFGLGALDMATDKVHLDGGNDQENLLFVMAATAHSYIEGVYTLLLEHRAKAGFVLLRPIFELYANAKYIYASDSEDNAIGFVMKDEVDLIRKLESILKLKEKYPKATLGPKGFDKENITRILGERRTDLENVQRLHPDAKETPNFRQRICDVDYYNTKKGTLSSKETPLEWQYLTLYYLLSQKTHLGSRGLSSFIEQDQDGSYHFVVDGKPDEVLALTASAGIFYLGLIEMVANVFHITLGDQIEQHRASMKSISV